MISLFNDSKTFKLLNTLIIIIHNIFQDEEIVGEIIEAKVGVNTFP